MTPSTFLKTPIPEMRRQGLRVNCGFDISQYAALGNHREKPLRISHIFSMRHGKHESVQIVKLRQIGQLDAIFLIDLARVRKRIMGERPYSEGLKFVDDVRHATVANVWHVFLEREAEHANACVTQRPGTVGQSRTTRLAT